MLKQLIAAFILFFPFCNAPSFAAKSPLNCPDAKQLFNLAEETVKALPPVAGLSIAIINPKCDLFTYVHGFANYATNLRMTDEVKLPIASNTKPILMTLALQLLEERKTQFPHGLETKLTEIKDHHGLLLFTADGKINQDDGTQLDLTDSDFYRQQTGKVFSCAQDKTYQCPHLDAIDLHHLLIESSGLNDFLAHQDLGHTGVPDIAKFILGKIFSDQADPGSQNIMNDVQMIKTFGLYQFANPDPIKPMQSHNIDAYLLAIILERVSGQSLNELLNDRILKPLHLSPDSMKFVTEPAHSNELIARRYAYFNTNAEVEYAIEHNTLFPMITPDLARMLTPQALENYHREVTYLSDASLPEKRPALDVLNLDGQGFTNGLGAGGMIAQPKAYIQFYRALAKGSLLSTASQRLFNDSFLAQPDMNDFKVHIGYGSNVRLSRTLPNGYQLSFLSHAGFVLGGESWTIYDENTETTIMIATNYSGYADNEIVRGLPAFFVTKTPYLNAENLMGLAQKCLALYGLNLKVNK